MSPARLGRRLVLGLPLGLAAGVPRAPAQQAGQSAAPLSRDPLANRFGGPFSLTDQHGRRVSEKDFLGRFVLIYFGFTRCTDTCPVDLPMIAAALDRLGEKADKLVPIMVTVDPEDTPAELKAYLAALHPRFVGLTGNEEELAAAARVYRVHRRKLSTADGPLASAHAGHTHAGHAHAGARYTIDHGSLAYLMAPDGRFLTLFPHNSGIERYVEVLGRYLG